MVKNRIHSLMDGFPLIRDTRSMKDIFSKKGVCWLKQIELPKYARRILDNEISLLEYLGSQIKHIDSGISGFGSKDQRVKNVMTIPGIGKFFSLLVVSEIDGIDRFRSSANSKKAVAFVFFRKVRVRATVKLRPLRPALVFYAGGQKRRLCRYWLTVPLSVGRDIKRYFRLGALWSATAKP